MLTCVLHNLQTENKNVSNQAMILREVLSYLTLSRRFVT